VRLKLAALLHDIGHYPFSHSLEEAGLPHHEELAARHMVDGELAQRLAELGIPAQRLLPLIQCRTVSPSPVWCPARSTWTSSTIWPATPGCAACPTA